MSFKLIAMPPKDTSKPVRCYIDLEIGDQDEYAREELGFTLAQDFLKTVGSQVYHIVLDSTDASTPALQTNVLSLPATGPAHVNHPAPALHYRSTAGRIIWQI